MSLVDQFQSNLGRTGGGTFSDTSLSDAFTKNLAQVKKLPKKKPKPIIQKRGIFERVKTGIGQTIGKITNSLQPQHPKPPQITLQSNDTLDSHLKFPSFFPNPDLSNEAGASAQLKPEANAASIKFLSNPIDSGLNATMDFLTYHPKALEVLADAQKIIEDTPILGLKGDVSLARGYTKGFSSQFLGSSQQVKDTFDKRLDHPVTWQGKTIDKVGEVAGGISAFIFGGEVLKGLGFAKATLPVLFVTLGQTSAPPETTLKQRFEKLAPDAIAGYLFSGIKPISGFGKEALKSLGKGTGVVSGQAVSNALIMGERDPKKIGKIVATQAVMMGLFHIAGTATGLLNEEIMRGKTKSGSDIFSPGDIKSIVNNSELKGSPEGEYLSKKADEAIAKNKNMKVDLTAVGKNLLGKIFRPKAKGRIIPKVELIDKSPELEGMRGTTPQGGVKPPISGEPMTPSGDILVDGQRVEAVVGDKKIVGRFLTQETGQPSVITDDGGVHIFSKKGEIVEGITKVISQPEKKAEAKGVKPEVKAKPKNLEQSIKEAKAKGLSAEEFVKEQLKPKIEIKEEPMLYPSKENNPYVGELAGKPTGKINYHIIVDGKEKGNIFADPKNKYFSVSSKSILGELKTKKFKTLNGAKNFIIKNKERFLPLESINLMTGERIVPKEKNPEFLRNLYNQEVKQPKLKVKPDEFSPKKKIKPKNLEQKRGKPRIKTARDAAKDLIRAYVERGDSIESLRKGQMGSYGGEYDASIGGYLDGKHYPGKIQVTKLAGKKIKEVFSLNELYKEIQSETKNRGKIKHGQETNNVSGRKARPKVLSNTIRAGKKTSRGIKKGSTKSGKSIGGKHSKRNAKPRERPPARLSKSQQVEINKEIERLVEEKGRESSKYSPKEKQMLRQYTGAGGLEKGGAEGRGLLDEYYTPPKVINFIWSELKKYLSGDKIGDVLEPSAGIGNFFEPVANTGVKMAYEINKTSADILKVLHPDAFVNNAPFEQRFISDRGTLADKITWENTADIVVGNPPYGEHRGKYLGLGEEPKIKKYEEYFLKRGLDVLGKNGLLAYVMPSSFLRSNTDYAKLKIGKMARLEVAYRLPNGIFGTTDIGTDIVIFRKGGKTDPLFISNDKYFDQYPKNILGEVLKGKGNYGSDLVSGTLDNALRMVGFQETGKIEKAPKPLAKSELPPEQKLDVGRVKAPKVVANAANKKAIIVSTKKDKTIRLSRLPRVDKKLWENIGATGEFNKSYLQKKFPNFTLKEFNDSNMAVSVGVPTNNGIANKIYPNILYYQGDIYEKLDNLEKHKNDLNPEQYSRQKVGLKKILPTPKKISEITIKPNSDFVKDLNIIGKDGEEFNVIKEFKVFLTKLPREAFSGVSSWEINRYIDGRIVNTGDKVRNIKVRRERRRIGDKLFKKFLNEEVPASNIRQIEDKYNRSFNAYYRPDYREVPLLGKINKTFNNKTLKMTDLQREGASFLSLKGSGLLGYEVGLGKTLTSIVAINESLQKGWTRKPLIVVPNSVYLQWINELQEIIPNVKINSLTNLGGKFKGDLKTLEIEDGTISIIAYSGLTKLGFRMETYNDLTKDLKDVMAGATGTKRSRAKEEERVGEVVGKAIKGTTGERFFEDLGFDHITIDEVHNFKNIFSNAKVAKGTGNEYRNVRGSTSARGIKAYLMTQYILKNNNERNVFLLSATPFTNSPLEIYSILSLMGKKRLEEIGLKNVNDFMSMFVDVKSKFVVKADQSIRQEDVVEKFVNLQQLQKLVTEFIDFKTGDESGVARPSRRKKTINLHPTKDQVKYVDKAQPMFNDKESGGAIVAITELQNITLSPYLSKNNIHSPTSKEFVENSPKIKFAVESIIQNKKDKSEAGQVIYMPRGVQFFPLLKQYLVNEGKFKDSEIGIIKGGMSIDAKYSVQNKFNKGKIKVLIGTEAIKEGVNLQENATDLYHLHLPWNPTDMLQIEGRIWRQGNKWKNIRVHYPLIENSVDSFIFQKLETKEKRIKNLWNYKTNDINIGDLDFETMKLDLITDPVIKVKAEKNFVTEREKAKLMEIKSERAFSYRKISAVEKLREDLKNVKEWLESARKNNNDRDVNYYSKRLKDLSRELKTEKNNLTKQGLDLVSLKKDIKKFDNDIAIQEKVINELDNKFKEKNATAAKKRVSALIKNNDFSKLMGKMAEENKTFFVKNKRLSTRYKKPPKTNSSAYFLRKKSRPGVAKTPEELKERINQLNKFAQSNAILRRTGKISKQKASGKFVKPGRFKHTKGVAKEGEVRLRARDIASDADYIEVLSHELGHALEYHVTGDLGRDTYEVFGDNLDKKTADTITKELKAITHELAGNAINAKNKRYYYKPSELLARFIEKKFVSPGNIDEIAPTVNKLFEQQSLKHPIIREFLEAANNEIDKKSTKFKFLPDLRQTYQKYLGERVGNIAYDEEIVHRAMQERAKYVIEKFVKKKFEDVKDDPATLFRAAEGIKVTRGGQPEFGTRDFVTAKNKIEEEGLKDVGWEVVKTEEGTIRTEIGKDGNAYPMYARARYTPEEAKAIFESLSPEGKRLIKDFTAQRAEAKDYFNREIVKDVNDVHGKIEGWVHHYFEEQPKTGLNKSLRFRKKKAGTRMKRGGKEGYVEDFQKAMTKALVDLEGEKAFNDFITRQFARVTKPIPEGQNPDAGWVEVMGELNKGVGLRQEKKVVIIKGGKRFIPKQARYQMPKEIYQRYKLWKGLVDEASGAVKLVGDINRYWRINVLTHLGTAGTNFISGGLQYSGKVITEFYMETLTGNVKYAKTRKNVAVMLKTLMPKGWQDAPDWIYGGDLSNWYGQFTKQPSLLNRGIRGYADKSLKVFGTYERYWKKVISLTENVGDLKNLGKMTKEGLRLPTTEERKLIADINREIDLYAYDYDNVPAWLEAHQRSVPGQLIKPFAKYPYKYAKQITGMVGKVFDRNRSWQERLATLLALTTMMGLYAAYAERRKKKQQTPEPSQNVPERMSTRGRLYVTTKDGKELFVRVSKYPFINLSQMGMELVNGHWESAKDLFSSMIGSIGVGGKLAALAFGYRHDYDKYKPVPVILGDSFKTFIPFFRVLNDISRMLDPFKRKQRTFLQSLTSIIPVAGDDLQRKLHGEKRTYKIPIEGNIKRKPGEKRSRTTTTTVLRNYWKDILFSMLTGIYINRIDPDEVKAIKIREIKNREKQQKIDEKKRSSFRLPSLVKTAYAADNGQIMTTSKANLSGKIKKFITGMNIFNPSSIYAPEMEMGMAPTISIPKRLTNQSKDAYYLKSSSKQITVKGGNKNNITRTKVPEKISETIHDVFGEELALEAAQVLHHTFGEQIRGQGNGENVGFEIKLDTSNKGYDTPLTTKKYVGDIKEKDGMWHSIDRGLFRINSRHFQDIMFGKGEGYRKAMYRAGILDDPIDSGVITKADVKKAWDKMNDLEYNIKMAKIMYDLTGWNGWFAAPIRFASK